MGDRVDRHTLAFIPYFSSKQAMSKKILPTAAWVLVFAVCIGLVVWLVRALIAAFP